MTETDNHTFMTKKLYNINFSQIKRFLERWNADQKFREYHKENISNAAEMYDVNLSVAELSFLCENKFLNVENESSVLIKKFIQQYEDVQQYKNYLQNDLCVPENLSFKLWRERQIKRCEFTFGKYNEELMHLPVAFELSLGCSVGCWFCSLDSQTLTKVFEYTEDNQILWKKCLHILKNIIGSAAGTGICYWATEPLDNPDYEKFCEDFFHELGYFPATTTAISHKYPKRIRKILKMSNENICMSNRFSVLTLDQLKTIHKEYSAEELQKTTLVLQNKESMSEISRSGRARKIVQKIQKNSTESTSLQVTGKKISGMYSTNTCVSGFLINMPEKTVKLITPCNASDKWPLGYKVIAQGTFDDSCSFEKLIYVLINDNMTASLKHDDKLMFNNEAKYTSLENGFSVTSPYISLKFCNHKWYKEIGEYIYEGSFTAGQIAIKIADRYYCHEAQVFMVLNNILKHGIFDEEKNIRKYN